MDRRSRLNDVVVGFGDRDAPPVPAPRPPPAADKEGGDKQAASTTDEEEVVDTGPTVEEADVRLRSLRKIFDRFVAAQGRHGAKSKRTVNLRDKLVEEFLEIRLTPKVVDALSSLLRRDIEQLREHERAVLRLCVTEAKMPRRHFVKSFQSSGLEEGWLDSELAEETDWKEALEERRPDIQRHQKKLAAIVERGPAPRSARSRTSTGASRSARRRRAGPRRRWWKPTSGS